MDYLIVQSALRGGIRLPLPIDHDEVWCEPAGSPDRQTYGATMYDTWMRWPEATGMIWAEGDIAIEPLHLAEMHKHILMCPGCVVAVPFRLYPASTHANVVQWPFYIETHNCGERILRADEPIPPVVRSFGLGCTYLPRQLFAALGAKLREWEWPSLDWRLSVAAREEGIPIMTTPTPAIHLHY